MTPLLLKKNADCLAGLARARALLAFDFDGTLAPIVADREVARMRPRTARLLTRLCGMYPCAVISGRSVRDVTPRLAGAPVQYLVGNHGAEPGGGTREVERDVADARALLEAALRSHPELEIEDKRFSLAVHYRRARHKRAAREAITCAARALPVAMRLVPGIQVVNVVPRHAPNKGEALLRLRSEAGAQRALYVGDDVTDEDVFQLDQPETLLTVRVGACKTSAARYFLRDQQEIDVLLEKMVDLREPNAA